MYGAFVLRPSPFARGFTLVELLTVIGIISLLISILVPALVKIKDQARRARTSAQISAVETALVSFQTEFKQYPESQVRRDAGTLRLDAVTDLPDGSGGVLAQKTLSGAHMMARALVGHDLQGIDNKGVVLKDGSVAANQVTMSAVQSLSRRGAYIEDAKVFVRDTDSRFDQNGSPATGRYVIVDGGYDFPLLYYRANSRAKKAFSRSLADTASVGGYDGLGIYNHEDNTAITGDGTAGSGWHFAAGTPDHPLAAFGPDDYHLGSTDVHTPQHSFVDFFHDEGVHEATKVGNTSQVIRPIKPDTFLIISPAKDGIYGTDDDISNFKRDL